MNWALTADGMAHAPKHRANVQVDGCTGPENGCSGCLSGPLGYQPKHRAVA